MAAISNVADTIRQLNQARNLCLADPNNLYPQIVPGLLPIIHANAELELRRWGTDFLAETFASPVLAAEHKQKLATQVLDALKSYLDNSSEDALVVKSVVQTASSVYQYVFRHIISTPTDSQSWQKMADIKSSILRRMDSAPAGVRLCCVKFIQRVVQVQTPGMIADPRRPDQNEISLALVPRDHPVIPPSNLEAEASGLLDRLLDVLQDNSRNPQHPLSGRIHGTLDRLKQSLVEVFDESRRKRPAPDEPTDGLSDAKRQRLGAEVPTRPPPASQPAPFPPTDGPVTFAQLFTLTQDQSARNFDVKVIPLEMVIRIIPPLLASVEPAKLDSALNAVRARFLSLSQPKPANARTAGKAAVGADDEDDYEPDIPSGDREQILNALDRAADSEAPAAAPPEIALGPFNLPPPPPLTEENTLDLSKGTVSRVFSTLSSLDAIPAAKSNPSGFHLLTTTNHDRQTWLTILTRLATRASAGLDNPENDTRPPRLRFSAPDAIRDALFMYIIEDFRHRIGTAISWLNEEWYADRISAQQYTLDGSAPSTSAPQPQYQKWLYKILDGFLPFLDAKDRLLIRFLSEIPDLDAGVVKKVVKLAADPDRVNLVVQALYYLVLYRPPVREVCLDGLEELWRDYVDAKTAAGKLLVKYRPGVMEGLGNGEVKVKTEG
ncbi:putative pre-tRNA-processing protein [Elsinoe australis]|uniref:Putative pre-tRNA-processing protein n=1 Tax=Elsinoe australis TaxID=40998 RepID=A0A4U7B855_9PEZI|nr:putative pre-tRNA-processing protein [Elsinoe australis]